MDEAIGNESKRIEKTNAERYQAAGAYGWQFRPDAPELLQKWSVMPFTQRGDKRLAFGVLTGMYQGLPFTAFEFHRRPTVTSVHTRWTNKKVSEYDTINIDSVWALTLPAPMPRFQIVSSVEPTFDIDQYPEPPTHDPKFNRWYKLLDTDPNVALQVLTPQVMSTMRQLKVHSWALVGNELVYTEHHIFGRTKPDDVLETMGKLASLVAVLPMHAGQQAPQPQYPQYQQPQYPQPQQPQYPQPQYPQYAQPQYPQPQYPQPQYQQPQYPQPQYGYPPQQGYPQPGYPGYPPPGYPS
jgi:hypothetical protein